MKKIFSNIILFSIILGGQAIASENSKIVFLQKGCKYYITQSNSGYHVIGAINHQPPENGTTIVGNYSKSGYQDMNIAGNQSPVYMDIAFNKLSNIEEAKKELTYKCME